MFLFFSMSTIQANDINATDSISINSSDMVSLQLDESAQFNGGEVNSDNLNENIKNQTELIAPTTSIYGYYTAVLKDSNANLTLANKNVYFVINNVNYNATTDSDGVAGVNLDVKPGNYEVSAYFVGDNTHENSALTSAVQVLPTIKANDMSKYYKGSTYTATFFDSQGKILANRAVTITVNGKSYTKKTNSNGLASLAINFKPGTYKVVSTNPVTGYKITTTFKVLSTITSSDLKKVAGDSKKFAVKFFKSNGKPLAKQYIKLKINGKIYKYKTNSKGQVYFAFKNYKKGTYKVISYNKDGLSKTNTVKIYSISTTKLTVDGSFYTFLPDDTKLIKVKLSTSIGDNSGKTIKLKINGKTFSKKTDSAGVVSFDLSSVNKGLFTAEYSYAGNKYFKASKTSNLVTILDSTDTKLTVKSTTNFGYGAGTLLKVAFTAGGVPLAKRTMTFTIQCKDYTDTTDNNGIASVPINLNIGNYTIKYKTNTNFKVNGTSGSCSITVFKRSESKLSWECGTSYKDSLQTFKVLLKDNNGKSVSGGIIELTIDGETYTGKTASNGYATIKTSVALGKYKVSVKFIGNNNLLPSSTSKSINVKLSKFGGGLNEKNSISYLSAYLKSTSYCQVNNAKVKALVNSLTSGLSDNIDKAKALFNYVRDEISYSYYYNSHKGAVGTLNSKSGNCVDQAHLLVAMYRTAGFKARYVHGTCTFSDGVFGHVWTQVLIGNTWVVGDPISYKNSLGKIKNWNTNTFKLKSRYLSPPF